MERVQGEHFGPFTNDVDCRLRVQITPAIGLQEKRIVGVLANVMLKRFNYLVTVTLFRKKIALARLKFWFRFVAKYLNYTTYTPQNVTAIKSIYSPSNCSSHDSSSFLPSV